MTDNIETGLRKAFFSAVAGSEDFTALENQSFDPAGKTKYYQFYYIPNNPEVAALGSGGTDAFTGFVQIDICIKKGEGKQGFQADYDALRAAFKAGARVIEGTTNIIITGCGRNGGGRLLANGFYAYAITIFWESRITRN